MPATSSTSPAVARHSRATVALHWLLAAALLAQVALGWWMLDLPKSPPGLRAGWFNLHKSIGLSIGAIVLLRVFWRARIAIEQHELLPAWQRRAARLTHALLYLCMLLLPLSGLLGSLFTRYPVRYFGWTLPDWNREWAAGKSWMSDLHAALAWLLMALVALHVAAALWHWLRRDGVVQRMGLPPRIGLRSSSGN